MTDNPGKKKHKLASYKVIATKKPPSDTPKKNEVTVVTDPSLTIFYQQLAIWARGRTPKASPPDNLDSPQAASTTRSSALASTSTARSMDSSRKENPEHNTATPHAVSAADTALSGTKTEHKESSHDAATSAPAAPTTNENAAPITIFFNTQPQRQIINIHTVIRPTYHHGATTVLQEKTTAPPVRVKMSDVNTPKAAAPAKKDDACSCCT